MSKARLVVGLAGTVTALSAMQLGLTHYDATRTHHSRLNAAQVAALCARLASVSVAERRPLLVDPARAEVIVGGAIVLSTILSELGLDEVRVSESDILDGLAASFRWFSKNDRCAPEPSRCRSRCCRQRDVSGARGDRRRRRVMAKDAGDWRVRAVVRAKMTI